MIRSIVDIILIGTLWITIIATVINLISLIWFLIDCHMEYREDAKR